MPQIIEVGREIYRINTSKNYIEFSRDGGRNWTSKCTSSSYGTFLSLQQKRILSYIFLS